MDNSIGRRTLLQGMAMGGMLSLLSAADAKESKKPSALAATPPMGWNSWDCFGASVREDEVKANADYMAAHLRPFGWEYVVVDIQWYEPTADGSHYHSGAHLDMDGYGRLIPSVNRFPSAANGAGFAPLARYCHERGLKFGIHILRGIPRQAVAAHTPILGTSVTAADVADTTSICPWNTDMYGVDATKLGAQGWYDSLIRLYHAWGVDFIKVDDLSRPYHTAEIEMLRRALDAHGPGIVFSTSPGETPLEDAIHIMTHANMWRMCDDFWDRWGDLRHAFDLCARWEGYAGPGHWPDADMLPLGHIALRSDDGGGIRNRQTRFTRDEQMTLMTLWCMARSPLMVGAHLPDNDPWTLDLLTNADVLALLKTSRNNRQLSRQGDTVIWAADGDRGARYAALFNLGESAMPIDVDFAAFGLTGRFRAHDLWSREDLEHPSSAARLLVAAHGTRLLRLLPV